ncbi:MAG TPA: TolC family protein [Kofleriaceae bacterium]|nr:TolC family protein [Kofleriaceae bacterium]
MRVAVVVLTALFASSIARADWLAQAFDAADGGSGGGGGGSGSAGSSSDVPALDDLSDWAGSPRAITLPELLQIAVKQAPALQNARLDVAVAEAQISETWARYDWRVQAQGSGARTRQVFDGIPLTLENFGANLDFSRQLSTGATIDLHADSQYSKNDAVFDGIKSTSETWQDDVWGSITQPLLKGRGRWLYDAQEFKARISQDVAVLARRSQAINTVQTVVSAYWDLVLAERSVAITQASLDLARERLRVTEIGVHGGKTAEAEVPAVLQTIATRQGDLLNGELAVLNASIALRRAAGMQIGTGELGLRVATDLEIHDAPFPLGALVQRALTASPELAELGKQQQSATIDIEVTSNGLLPQLDAALQLGPSGQSIGNPPGTQASFANAAKDLYELNLMSISGSLTYSRSIGQHDIKGRIHELTNTREKLRVNATDIRAQVAQAMARAVASLELAKRRVVLAQRAIELAKQNIQIETDRFNLGTRTNFDVLNRQEELRQAELSEAQAQTDWHKAETSVQALTGDILPAFGVTVE